MQFTHVDTPIRIGTVEIKNRILRSAHSTAIGGGTLSDDLVAYHEARAKGGVGLTIIEALAVGSSAYPFLVSGAPGLVEGYRDLAAQCAPCGV